MAGMTFCLDDEIKDGRNRAVNYLITDRLGAARESSRARLLKLIDRLGPVVRAYPFWHPLVTSGKEGPWCQHFATLPDQRSGYEGLDHTIFLRGGFITCPYGDTAPIHKSVDALADNADAEILSEDLDFPLYASSTRAVLVTCDWSPLIKGDGTIPRSIAAPLMLAQLLPVRKYASFRENWDAMRSDILGWPCGDDSSLFVNQETARYLRTLLETVNESGMFGPPRPSKAA